MTQDVSALIAEREKTHGDFSQGAAVMQGMKGFMRLSPNWASLTVTQAEALEMIVHKIGRILAGDPNCADHYRDIQGYAQLVLDRIKP